MSYWVYNVVLCSRTLYSQHYKSELSYLIKKHKLVLFQGFFFFIYMNLQEE